MIAGRRGNHAAGPLVVGQLEQFIERAAFLEGGGELEVLELQPDFGADDLGQSAAEEERGADHGAGDAIGGGADVVDIGRCHAGQSASPSLARRQC